MLRFEGKQVSWLPSYGPEMRGGTANCAVILSDEAIGSPLIQASDILVAMNLPSFTRFAPLVKAGGVLVADSSLIELTSEREDISAHYVPATRPPGAVPGAPGESQIRWGGSNRAERSVKPFVLGRNYVLNKFMCRGKRSAVPCLVSPICVGT